MLIIFGGLPGVGKTSLARVVANRLEAVYVRIDSIEQAIRNSVLKPDDVMDSGYMVGFEIAKDNLRLGRIVVADSVNPIDLCRTGWKDAARSTDSKYIEIEVICSDKGEHKKRVETRESDIATLTLPSWQEVQDREYEKWNADIVIDTANKDFPQIEKEILQRLLEITNSDSFQH
jgi:predicted kinase